MKRWIICAACLLLILSGCKNRNQILTVSQPADQITCVEFVDNREEPVVREITDPETIRELVKELSAVELERAWNDPPAEYGKFHIRIHFANGDVQIIGYTATGYISGGIEEMNMWYSPDLDPFDEILKRYAGFKIE